jgi:hypothetical protein
LVLRGRIVAVVVVVIVKNKTQIKKLYWVLHSTRRARNDIFPAPSCVKYISHDACYTTVSSLSL